MTSSYRRWRPGWRALLRFGGQGQQPFGGARSSGTNDKAGAAANLMRWISPRLIKETFVPAKNYRYPYLE